MPRPVVLGIIGDSASGKTTLTRGVVRLLGEDQVTHLSADGYHRFDRAQRLERHLTPLDPECNHMDILTQHLRHLRAGDPVLAPVYHHKDGTFRPPIYLKPGRFAVVEGLLGFQTAELRAVYDVRVFLDPPEDLRRAWKVQRDCSRRGYTTDRVLDELDRREPDAEAYVRPQRRYADLVVSFMPGDRGDQAHLDARITMRPGLIHPDLSLLADGKSDGIRVNELETETVLWVPGTISAQDGARVQASIWDRMHFASHLRSERLGEFTVGTQLHRSESLAITQLLLLYQLVAARAAVAIGGDGARVDTPMEVRAPAPHAPR
jgi:phosphoribulokinase